VVGDTVFVASTEGLYAYDAATGALRWRHQTGESPVFLAAADGVLYASVVLAGHVRAFDADGCGATECSPLWSTDLDWTGAPSVANGVLYVGTHDAIAMFDAGGCGAPTCSPVATEPVDGDVTSVAITQGKVFAHTNQPSTVAAYASAPAGGPG
jgi:outer membrane protein assembly factor BamB